MGDAPTPRKVKALRLAVKFLPIMPPALEGGEDPLVVAANPRPAWMLEVMEGTASLGQWALWHPLDVASAETVKLLAIEREISGASSEEYLKRIREQIGYLVPDLPDDIYPRLSPFQLLAIGQKSWQAPAETRAQAAERKADAENPPVGAGASAPSSPSPHDDSDGATPR
jgi:hypothetical protein